MATPITTEAMRKGIEAIFDDVYSKHSKHIHNLPPYILEQCGKLYRVKKTLWGGKPEYKSGWLKLNEAQAIMKLMEVSEDGTS